MGDGTGGSTNFPPVGEPDRYDMIVQRGRALRRRRRYTLGAGAGGTAVAIAVAVVLVSGGGSDGANATEFADGDTSTTAAVVTASVPMPAEMTVTIDEATSTVLVQDPTQPQHDTSKQCVYLQLTHPDGTVAAEGSGCNTNPGPIDITVHAETGTEVPAEISRGCTLERYEPDPDQPIALADLPTDEASSTFVYRLDPALAAGGYEFTAIGVSGVTDGCDDTEDPDHERQNVDDDTISIELP